MSEISKFQKFKNLSAVISHRAQRLKGNNAQMLKQDLQSDQN